MSGGGSLDPSQGVTLNAGAIILAAGEGRRMGGVDKLFTLLLGKPLIAHTLLAFDRCPQIQVVVLVVSSSNVRQAESLVREGVWSKSMTVCLGGPRRQDSVRLGLQVLPPCQWVVVHDGARPCVEPWIVENGLLEAQKTGAAVAAVPTKDTVKVVAPEGRVLSTPDRDTLWTVQTPQIFQHNLLMKAHLQSSLAVTDDASLVEQAGHPVMVFQGSYSNIKVTTPEDLLVAEAILRARKAEGSV